MGISEEASNQIRQSIDDNQGQAIGQMIGGLAVGQLVVYLSQIPTESKTTLPINSSSIPDSLLSNPYQGLQAFRETDGDRFFGRERDIAALVERFQQLQVDRTTIRLLPIYGPSGSGKSSLARAGLIPALGRMTGPQQPRSRVVVLTPGHSPLTALATVLARIATQDPTPLAKTREFLTELRLVNEHQEFDGLCRLADIFPDIEYSPLIILVDQFEEVYTLCKDQSESHIFVENLLGASQDSAQHVSVILTMRSDFLGATHQHPQLNQLFSSQGFLVPMMQRDQLAIAITKPAKQAGYELDKATVQLLLEQTAGQEGTLPLLQFALTEIWEGLRQHTSPADTLERIGGVGGALANKARSLYESLSLPKQKIARSIFLSLIQLHDDRRSTRRRVAITELVTQEADLSAIHETIDCFARPGVWILVTSSNNQQLEMVEIAHEALIGHWKELQEWLKLEWNNLCQKHKIEEAAKEWEDHQKSSEYLLQGRKLRDAHNFCQSIKKNLDYQIQLSSLGEEFVKISLKESCSKKIKTVFRQYFLPTVITLFAFHILILCLASQVLYSKECKGNFLARMLLEYQVSFGFEGKKLKGLKLCELKLSSINLSASRSVEIIEDVNFSGADVSNADFIGTSFRNVTFDQGSNVSYAKFQGALFVKSSFNGVDFSRYSDLSGARFRGGEFKNVTFPKNKKYLSGTKFKDVDLSQTNLTAEHLSVVKLCKVILPQSVQKIKILENCTR